MKFLPVALLSVAVLTANVAHADNFGMFPTKHASLAAEPYEQIHQLVKDSFDVSHYKKTIAQVIYNSDQQPDHVLVFLFANHTHSVEVARININQHYLKAGIINNYQVSAEDTAQQPGESHDDVHCTTPDIQSIAFAPNDDVKYPDDELEQTLTIQVDEAAKAHGLKTLRLLGKDASRSNYLNAMTCPQLEGNFYDGDANPDLIITHDGFISAFEVKHYLSKQFRYKVVNIWLACQAFQDPFKSVMLVDAESQKYAAGINNLLIGPSDRAAVCTMIAAFDNKPMTAAFQDCYQKLDDPRDHWGFDGNGTDYFGA